MCMGPTLCFVKRFYLMGPERWALSAEPVMLENKKQWSREFNHDLHNSKAVSCALYNSVNTFMRWCQLNVQIRTSSIRLTLVPRGSDWVIRSPQRPMQYLFIERQDFLRLDGKHMHGFSLKRTRPWSTGMRRGHLPQRRVVSLWQLLDLQKQASLVNQTMYPDNWLFTAQSF